MSGWLPFEQQLREFLRYEDNPASAGDSHHEIQSKDDSDMENEESDKEEESEADLYSEPGLNDDRFKQSSPSHDDFNPFEEDEEEAPLFIQAINHIRDILGLPMISINEQLLEDSQPPSNLCHLQIPVFIGHGLEDRKVSARLGKKMSHILSTGLGMDVTWEEYKGLGH